MTTHVMLIAAFVAISVQLQDTSMTILVMLLVTTALL
jgi:hypothetical protein